MVGTVVISSKKRCIDSYSYDHNSSKTTKSGFSPAQEISVGKHLKIDLLLGTSIESLVILHLIRAYLFISIAFTSLAKTIQEA
ncbi:hypothetical protein ES708_35021 [subsurface metagenome]